MKKPDLCCSYPEHISPLIEGMRLPAHSRRAWQRADLQSPVLSQWLLNCPYVHPAWSYWLISLIHLRPTPGLPNASRLKPDSEYEIVALAIDPAELPDPESKSITLLRGSPCIQRQFGRVTDPDAIEITESCILACVGNHLSPDQVWQRRWDRFIDGYVNALVSKNPVAENTL